MKYRQGSVLFYLILSIFVAAPSLSLASDKAKEAYAQGIELFDQGEYKKAAEKFRSAYAQKASWKMFYNIGQAEAAGQRYGLALEAFETYLVEGGDDVPEEKKESVTTEIKRLRVLVGVVELDAKPGSELIVDDKSRGTTPFEGAVRVAAGKRSIVVKLNGEVIYDQVKRIAGGMTTTITALPENSGPAEPAASETDRESEDSASSDRDSSKKLNSKMKAGIVVGGVGVVGLGLGTAFLIKGTIDNKKALDSDDQSVRDDYDDNVRPLNIAMTTTGFIVAGVGLATGTLLLVLGNKERKKGTARVIPEPGGLSIHF